MIRTNIEVLKAGCGDCILVSIIDGEETFRILIDGGVPATYLDLKLGYPLSGNLKVKLDELKSCNGHIDLLVITHIDDDHIGGLLNWFVHDCPDNSFVREIWFNDNILVPSVLSTDNSKESAIAFKCLLDSKGIHYKNLIVQNEKFVYNWGTIRILSPNVKYHNKISNLLQETLDKRQTTDNSGNSSYQISIDDLMKRKWNKRLSDANKSSIAFLLTTRENSNYLFLGDADINVIIKGLKALDFGKDNKLKCESIKLPHHGSKNNYTDKFLDMVSTKNFIISTDGSIYGHPDKEVIAHILTKTDSDILFNYDSVLQNLFTKEDLETYPMINSRCKPITCYELH